MLRCALCGSVSGNYQAFQNHRSLVHKLIESTRKPVRTKKQIVDEAENTWLKPFIIQSNDGSLMYPKAIELPIVHDRDCHCGECFQKALDQLVNKSGENL